MATNLQLKIDVKKIDKVKLFVGEKGTYLDASIIMNDEPDQYGNCGMIVQNVTKEEREAGKKGAILGNAKWMQKKQGTPQTSAPQQAGNTGSNTQDIPDDLPF